LDHVQSAGDRRDVAAASEPGAQLGVHVIGGMLFAIRTWVTLTGERRAGNAGRAQVPGMRRPSPAPPVAKHRLVIGGNYGRVGRAHLGKLP
jgi:hypothetical protein